MAENKNICGNNDDDNRRLPINELNRTEIHQHLNKTNTTQQNDTTSISAATPKKTTLTTFKDTVLRWGHRLKTTAQHAVKRLWQLCCSPFKRKKRLRRTLSGAKAKAINERTYKKEYSESEYNNATTLYNNLLQYNQSHSKSDDTKGDNTTIHELVISKFSQPDKHQKKWMTQPNIYSESSSNTRYFDIKLVAASYDDMGYTMVTKKRKPFIERFLQKCEMLASPIKLQGSGSGLGSGALSTALGAYYRVAPRLHALLTSIIDDAIASTEKQTADLKQELSQQLEAALDNLIDFIEYQAENNNPLPRGTSIVPIIIKNEDGTFHIKLHLVDLQHAAINGELDETSNHMIHYTNKEKYNHLKNELVRAIRFVKTTLPHCYQKRKNSIPDHTEVKTKDTANYNDTVDADMLTGVLGSQVKETSDEGYACFDSQLPSNDVWDKKNGPDSDDSDYESDPNNSDSEDEQDDYSFLEPFPRCSLFYNNHEKANPVQEPAAASSLIKTA